MNDSVDLVRVIYMGVAAAGVAELEVLNGQSYHSAVSGLGM